MINFDDEAEDEAAEEAAHAADRIRLAGTPTLVGGAGKTLGGLIDDVQLITGASA